MSTDKDTSRPLEGQPAAPRNHRTRARRAGRRQSGGETRGGRPHAEAERAAEATRRTGSAAVRERLISVIPLEATIAELTRRAELLRAHAPFSDAAATVTLVIQAVRRAIGEGADIGLWTDVATAARMSGRSASGVRNLCLSHGQWEGWARKPKGVWVIDRRGFARYLGGNHDEETP